MPAEATRKSKSRELNPLQLKKYFEAKLAAELGPHDVKKLLDSGSNLVLLDVRAEQGFKEGRIPGAVNIPLDQLSRRFKELPRAAQIVSYCWNPTCLLCTRAAYLLASKGYQAREMVGGIEAWKQAGFPVET